MRRRMELALSGSSFAAVALRAASALATGPTSDRFVPGPSPAAAAADDRMVLAMGVGVLIAIGILDGIRRLITRGGSGRHDDRGD